MSSVTQLTSAYPSRYGTPIIRRVDTAIFLKRYFSECLNCTFCGDWCCTHGVDVDTDNVGRIESVQDDLEAYIGVPKDRWFTGTFTRDKEFAGGAFTRTQVVNGACVFLDRRRRGCMLHRYCVDRDMDYHDLKPMVSCLFPLTFDDGLLHTAGEVADGTLVCMGSGPTMYRSVRAELLFYFGEALVNELDTIERAVVRLDPDAVVPHEEQ